MSTRLCGPRRGKGLRGTPPCRSSSHPTDGAGTGSPTRASGATSPRGAFAVISPDGMGRRLAALSYGYEGQIDDLARMPDVASEALPWLRIDRSRIYALGTSMGGQETLLLVVRHPRLLAGAVAMDSVTDLARRSTASGCSVQRCLRPAMGSALRPRPPGRDAERGRRDAGGDAASLRSPERLEPRPRPCGPRRSRSSCECSRAATRSCSTRRTSTARLARGPATPHERRTHLRNP